MDTISYICGAVVLLAVSSTAFPSVPLIPDPCPQGYHVHPSDCRKFLLCDAFGNPNEMQCPNLTVFNPLINVCVDKNSTWYDDVACQNEEIKPDNELSPQAQCEAGTGQVFPHPKFCQRYYNCSDTSPRHERSPLEVYEGECPYPDLFDQLALKCLPYTEAKCQPDATIGVAPCDYVINQCVHAHCQACSSRLPSCLGKPDGFHENPLKLWSPFYVRCKDERSVEFLYCESEFPVFSPIERRCVVPQ